MKRLAAAAALACLLLAPPSHAIAVFDAANFRQAVADHLKRLFEIGQRATQILNQLRELEYWFYAALKNERIPYREEVLEFLILQGELLRDYEVLKGQFQALTHSLEEVTREFDVTFPGWKATSQLAGAVALEIETEAGRVRLDSPLALKRYQAARTLQATRQTIALMGRDLKNLEESQAHLEHLKEAVPEAKGEQQTREIQTSFAALSAEQLIALRQTQEAMASMLATLGAFRLNAEMQLGAEIEGASETLGEGLKGEFGALVPEHTGENGLRPFPWWVVF